MYYTNCNNITVSGFSDAHDKFVNKKRAEQFIALGKLLQLRDYWTKRSEFKDAICIFTLSDRLIVTDNCDINDYALTFPTKEMADKFITCFRDLIIKASPLV